MTTAWKVFIRDANSVESLASVQWIEMDEEMFTLFKEKMVDLINESDLEEQLDQLQDDYDWAKDRICDLQKEVDEEKNNLRKLELKYDELENKFKESHQW